MKDKLKVEVLASLTKEGLKENNQHYATLWGGEWSFIVEERTYPQNTTTGKVPGFVLTLSVITTSPGVEDTFPGFNVNQQTGEKYKKLWQRAYELGPKSELTTCRLLAYTQLLTMGLRTFNGLAVGMEPGGLDEVSNPSS